MGYCVLSPSAVLCDEAVEGDGFLWGVGLLRVSMIKEGHQVRRWSRADGEGCEGVQSLRVTTRTGSWRHPIEEGTAERPERALVGLLSIRGAVGADGRA
jgi:hypothetical protein